MERVWVTGSAGQASLPVGVGLEMVNPALELLLPLPHQC